MPKAVGILGLLALPLTLVVTATSRADSWAAPKTFQVTSKDGTYRLTVEPSFGGRPTNVIRDASGKAVRPKALGRLEKKVEEGEYRVIWEHPLTNDVCPVSALVADDGAVVTMDNWHSMGYGSNVVVVYAPDGKLVRSMGLDGFLSPEESRHLPTSVSSIWWGRDHHFDERQEWLILNVGNGGLTPGDRATPKKTVRLRLKTGEVVKEEAGGANAKEVPSASPGKP